MKRVQAQQREKTLATFPRQRRAGLSPRAYQARRDLCRLWNLVHMQKSQAEIAQEMGKDTAWVSRSIKRIHSDFSILYATPDENQMIHENLARLESLYAEALRILSTSTGHSRISACRLVAEIVRQQAEYQVTVGWVANRRHGEEARRAPTMEELRDEISDQDLDAIVLRIADDIKEQKTNQRAEIARR